MGNKWEKGQRGGPFNIMPVSKYVKGSTSLAHFKLAETDKHIRRKMTHSTKSGEGVEKDKRSAKTGKICAEKDKFRNAKKVPKRTLHLVKPGYQQNQTSAPYFF